MVDTTTLSDGAYAEHMRLLRGQPPEPAPIQQPFNINNVAEATITGDMRTYSVMAHVHVKGSLWVKGPSAVIVGLYDRAGMLEDWREDLDSDSWRVVGLRHHYTCSSDRKIYLRVTGGTVREGSWRILVEPIA